MFKYNVFHYNNALTDLVHVALTGSMENKIECDNRVSTFWRISQYYWRYRHLPVNLHGLTIWSELVRTIGKFHAY
ncbi:hypothetical protein [Vibrio gallaecicus]|uniref:hypothetical protein n=1 Tax=Vibrio gallaecicus TaxID=552386 RepID=UPI0025B506C3|nr:hypothetical protein [Vibrio gallaecicus]MDN3614588.1 hypothetical protein [Vibrio gallaecicus]